MKCLGESDGLSLLFVTSQFEDSRGDVWVGGNGRTCRIPGGTSSPQCTDVPTMSRETGNVLSIGEDSRHDILITSAGGGGWRFVMGAWQPIDGQGWRDATTLIVRDRHGNLWSAPNHGGLTRIYGDRREEFRTTDGLSGDRVHTGFEDREGNLWFATSNGLDRFRDVRVVTMTGREGLLQDSASSVTASRDGGVWTTNPSIGVVRVDAGGRREALLVGRELPRGRLSSVFEDSGGRLWIGLGEKLLYRENDLVKELHMPDRSSVGVVRAIGEDAEGNIWVATTKAAHALIRIRDGVVIKTMPLSTFGMQIGAIMPASGGGIWLAILTRELSLARYHEDRLTTQRLGKPSAFRSLFVSGSREWTLTRDALVAVGDGTFTELSKANGLPCAGFAAGTGGNDGAVWLSGECGVIRISAAGHLGVAGAAIPQGDSTRLRYFRRGPNHRSVAVYTVRHSFDRWTNLVCGSQRRTAGDRPGSDG